MSNTAKPNAGRDALPATLTIATLFVTCPSCSNDIPANLQADGSEDWSAGEMAEFLDKTDPEDLVECPECGQPVTISLPKTLPASL